MGAEEQKKALEELHISSREEQARAEQEVFNGLNSTDRILNLVRESMQLLEELSVRQDGLCMVMDSVMEQAMTLESMSPEEAERMENVAQISEFVTQGSSDLLQVVSVLQAVLEEAERANGTLHLLEEHLVEYADVNERLYEKFDKGELE